VSNYVQKTAELQKNQEQQIQYINMQNSVALKEQRQNFDQILNNFEKENSELDLNLSQ
jgi:hypothetical protein